MSKRAKTMTLEQANEIAQRRIAELEAELAEVKAEPVPDVEAYENKQAELETELAEVTDNMEQCHHCGLWRDEVSEIYKLQGNLNEVLANEGALLKLVKDRDQSAFVFTSRLKALCDEFEGKISTAAAVGAFEVVKHELIAEALSDGGE